MLVSYPALFYKDPEGGYFIHFPDFENSATQGNDISDAMFMASDWLGLVVSDNLEEGEKLPKPSNINELSLSENDPFKHDEELRGYYIEKDSFISMVCVDLEKYLDYKKLVKKTLTIPKWANDLGNRLNLNFSQLLTTAIEDVAIK